MKDLKPAGLNKDEGFMGTPTNEGIGIHDAPIGKTTECASNGFTGAIEKDEGYLESPSK